MPAPLLAASDFDPFQGAIIVIALVAGFIKWLWENWQMRSEAAQRERETPPPDPEELRRRDEAWKRQMGQGGQGGQPAPRPAAARPAPSSAPPSAWDELRKAWDELKEAARQSQEPASPPPRPQRPRPSQPAQRQPEPPASGRGSVGATLSAAEARLAATREAAAAAAAAAAQRGLASEPPMVQRRDAPGGALLGSLQNLRHDPALLRQAVLLHEILGPPKALQSSTDLAN